jgi:broad specificity phosphatase PhoE
MSTKTNFNKNIQNPNIKQIHWIRHGESESNVSDSNSNIIDPKLTSCGIIQCVELKRKLNSTNIDSSVELYLVSPLERTLGTFINVFGENTPGLAIEEIREYIDKPCHKRFNIKCKKSQSKYKYVCFNHIKSNYDHMYKITHGKETLEHLVKRIEQFLDWIGVQKESKIVVITHGEWLFTLFNTVLENNPKDKSKVKYYTNLDTVGKKYVNTFFNNCEIKTTDVYFC